MSDCEYPRIISRVKLVHVPFLLGDANGWIGWSDYNIFTVGYFTLHRNASLVGNRASAFVKILRWTLKV